MDNQSDGVEIRRVNVVVWVLAFAACNGCLVMCMLLGMLMRKAG